MKKLTNIIYFLSIFFAFYLIFYLGKDSFNVHSISHINILKALDWLNGNPDWLGPHIPHSIGNLPGPFFYFLIIPPLLLNNPYTSLILYLIGWLSLTFTVAFYFVKKITKDSLSPFLFLILILTSYFFRETLLYIQLNNLFSILFHLILMIYLTQWRKEKKDLYLILTGLFMGLGVQVHHSILFHFITIIVFLITYEKIAEKQFEWKYFTAFISVFLLPQIPYLSVLFSNDSELYIRNYEYEHINWLINNFLSNPLNSLQEIFLSLDIYNKESLIRMLAISLLGLMGYFYKTINREEYSVDDSMLSLLIITINPILLTFPFINSWFNSFFLFLFVLIIFVKWNDNFWPKKEVIKYSMFLTFSFILIINLVSSTHTNLIPFVYEPKLFALLFCILLLILLSYKPLFKTEKYVLSIALTLISLTIGYNFSNRSNGFKSALKHIYQNTGWSDKEAIQRVFQFGFNGKSDFLFYYRLVIEEIGPVDKKKDVTNNKGYFIIKKNGGLEKHSLKEWKDFFLNNEFPDEVKKELKRNSLLIQNPHHITKSIDVVPYVIKSKTIFPKGFHNMGKSHFKEPDWSKNTCYFPSLIKAGKTFYLCYVLYNYVGEKISFLINFSKIKKKSFLKAEITGFPLTIASSYRKDFHFIENIIVEFSCGKKMEKVKLLSRIGYNIDKSQYFKSFFAPMELQIPVKCKNLNNIKNVNIAFNHKVGYNKAKQILFSYPPQKIQ